MSVATLILKKNEERRLKAGHLWIYSNEVDVKATPLTGFEPGQEVVVNASNGKPLGRAYVNPHSLICARVVDRHSNVAIDRSLFVHRFNVALSLRQRLFDKPFYRLVYGESDGLPGLVVDRFGDVLVVQCNTAGMDVRREAISDALHKVLKPQAIIYRNDSAMRSMEGLPNEVIVEGEIGDSITIEENGVAFEVPLTGGQKTGWFYDHRQNRAALMQLVASLAKANKPPRVLDVFSYIGGWGIQAAVAGAAEVNCLDASATALDYAERSAALNGVDDRCRFLEGDAFEALKALKTEGEQFDLIVLDPPAFIKRRKDVKAGIEGYRRINQLAMQLLGKDGFLVSASCSYHLQRDQHLELVQRSGRHLERFVQVIHDGSQGADHPVHPVIPETQYLKSLTTRVVLL